MSDFVLGIDPGNEISGAILIRSDDRAVVTVWPGVNNEELLRWVVMTRYQQDRREGGTVEVAIEMISSYGMAVGRTVFQTCVWVGRFQQAFGVAELIERKDCMLNICNSRSAKDANIRRALLDRYPETGGGRTKEVGTKAQPGPLYGVSRHAFSALAVAHTHLDIIGGLYTPAVSRG